MTLVLKSDIPVDFNPRGGARHGSSIRSLFRKVSESEGHHYDELINNRDNRKEQINNREGSSKEIE